MGININIYNALLFQIGWLLCVFGGNQAAMAVAAIVLYVHLRFVSGNLRELQLLLQIMLLGFVADSLFIFAGLITDEYTGFFPPFWLTALWLVFATTLNHSLRWFQSRLAIAMVVGAVAGPMSYWAGTNISSFQLGESSIQSLILLGVSWALIFPASLMMAKRFNEKYVLT